MALKVIQWATGSIGRESIRCIREHPELELVGCWVHSPEKAGRDVGELIGGPHVGVTTTASMEEILSMHADAVMYSPLLPRGKEVAALLRSGKNVVTPVGWFYPTPAERERMDAACLDGGVSLHGTGMDPGAVTEVLPLLLSAMSSGVTFMRGEELSDVRKYGSTDVVKNLMMFGGTPEHAMNGPMMEVLGGGYSQSLFMMTDTLGIDPDDVEIKTVQETAVATAPIESPIGTIQPGEVAGQRFFWDAYIGEHHVARAGVTWLMGEQHLDPPWEFGALGERFEFEVKGDPDTFVSITSWHPHSLDDAFDRNPGLIATAAHCVNAIPYVFAAPAGVRTSVDLPMVAGRISSRISAPRQPISQ